LIISNLLAPEPSRRNWNIRHFARRWSRDRAQPV